MSLCFLHGEDVHNCNGCREGFRRALADRHTQTRGTNPSLYTNIKTKPPKKGKGK
jgi:hypothetical protein